MQYNDCPLLDGKCGKRDLKVDTHRNVISPNEMFGCSKRRDRLPFARLRNRDVYDQAVRPGAKRFDLLQRGKRTRPPATSQR